LNTLSSQVVREAVVLAVAAPVDSVQERGLASPLELITPSPLALAALTLPVVQKAAMAMTPCLAQLLAQAAAVAVRSVIAI
jgi:hypothetical protein